MSGQLMIPAADTQLHAVDTPGGTPPLLFLSGGFGSVQNWDHVIRRLAQKYRTVRFDARARGKSGTSADYSVRGAVDDIGRVIDATDIERPILVGWSYGATIAVRYAAQHPEQVGGLVLIDGAYPITMFDEAGRAEGPEAVPPAGMDDAHPGGAWPFGPDDSRRVRGRRDRDGRRQRPTRARLRGAGLPDRVRGRHRSPLGRHRGRDAHGARRRHRRRASNERVSVFATTPHKHTQILNKAPDTVVAAIEDVVDRSR